MTAFELAGKLKLDSSEFTSSLGKQESIFKKFGNKISNTSKMISKIAKASVVAGTVMFTKASIQEGLNFDKAMSQVAATLGKTTDEVQDLAKFAREMGSKTAFSATEAAEALNYMALAGYDADTSMKMLPTVLNLAAAGNIDLAKASDMVTDAQSALGLSIEETERMVDQMAKTSSKTNTSVEQLGDAFLTVGGTAKMMGKGSIDTTTELSMALGVLADNGIKGAEGGTMLRNILLSLSAPTDKAAKKLKQLGVDVFDSSGEMRDLPFILQDINEATKDMTDQERTDFLSEVFNKRDLKAIEALLGTDIGRWEELYDEIGNAEGSAEKMAETQLDNLAGDLTIFKSALSEAKLSISDKLSPTLRKFVQRGTQWVQRLTNAFNEKGLSGAIGEAKTIVKELITESLGLGSDASWADIGRAAVQKLKDGIRSGINKAKIKLANLLGLTDSNGQAVDDPSDVSWANVAKAAYEKAKNGFTEFAGQAKVKLANLLGLTDESGNAVDDPSDTTWGNVAEAAFGKIKEKFVGVAGDAKVNLANWLGLTDDAGNAVDDPSDTSWDKIAESMKTKLQGGFEKLKVKLSDLLGINAKDVGGEVEWADIGKSIIDKLTSYFSHKGDFLKKLILGDEFTDKSTWTDVGKKISGWLTEAFSEGGLLNAILGEGSERLSAIITFAGDLLTGLAQWMASNSGELTSMLVTLVTAIAGALSEAAGPIITALAQVLGSPDLWNAVLTGLGSIGEALLDAILGKDITNAIRRFFGVEIPGEISSGSTDTVKAAWIGIMDEYLDDPSQEGAIAAKWNDFMTGVFNKSKLDPSMYNDFMDQFDFDNMFAAFKSMNMSDFYSALSESLNSINDGTGKIKKLRQEAEDTAGDYKMVFTIETNGTIPHIRTPDTMGGELPGHDAKGEWNVPYDDYYTRLHRGEMVLSASQARDYRSGNSGMDTSAIVGAIQSLKNDLANLKLVVGRKTFGRAVVSYGGSGMNDYLGGSESRFAAGYGT